MTEPHWLSLPLVLALHERLLGEFGGGAGLRDDRRLDTVIERPRQAFRYGIDAMHALAACYAVAIVQGHPFLDGNKRTGFLCATLFLERNGFVFIATEEEALEKTLALAASEITETEYASWLKANCKPA